MRPTCRVLDMQCYTLKVFCVEVCRINTLSRGIGSVLFVGLPQPKKSRVMRGTLIVKDGVRRIMH